MKSFVAYRQARLQCCGINEASDWTRYPGLPEPPSSCYFTRFVQHPGNTLECSRRPAVTQVSDLVPRVASRTRPR